MTTFSQQPPLETGVSQTLAKWRAANYSDVRYKLNVALEKGAPLMKGEIEIHVTLTDEGAKNDLILDWRTTQFANDKDKPYAHVTSLNGKTPLVIEAAEHLRISHENLKKGENIIQIEFASPVKTSGAAVTRYIDKEDGGEYLYSLFVPSDASTAFPCFDQPDLKARFQLSVRTSSLNWKVISNTNASISEYNFGRGLGNPKESTGNVFAFEETKPISTYVFAFAAGDFEEFADTKAPVKMVARKKEPGESMLGAIGATDNSDEVVTIDKVPPRIYVRKSQAAKFKPHAAEVFRLNREAVKYLENYFDYKYPFPKYDFVLIPEFPFGGMEHAGATFLKESSIIFPTEPTKNDYISRATLIFHETAHQWFGDTVTMKWFDDLWLKEGFAEFMAYKTMEKVLPEYNAWKIFYERNKQAAYLTDSTRGTTPIYQEIPNLSAAKSAYGNIVYRKAPSFLRQAEFYLGEDKFQTAVRAFLKKHEFANATWQDLVNEFETSSKQDLKNWAESWVKERGVLTIKIGKRYPNDKKQLYGYFSQKDIDNEPTCRQMKFVLYVKYESGKIEKNKFWIDCGAQLPVYSLEAVNGIILDPKEKLGNPDLIFPNYQDYGYGIFLLDDKSRAYVLANIQTEKDDFLRAMMWGSLWDSVRETELAPKDYVALVIKNINVETDESTISTLLGRVSTAMNYYLSDAQRAELAPAVEKLLIDKIQNSKTAGQRITYYRALLNIASTENARAVLRSIYNEDLGIGGGDTKMRAGMTQTKNGTIIRAAAPVIQLKPKDRFDIVTRLLILGDPNAPEMLANLEKLQAGDDAKRYAYAAKAGIATEENKAKFWNDFLNNKEISENWIESAFVPFNSPRHSELTLPYLERALAELPNLKKNRKIFFVNGWLSAFIGGQKSERALEIVNKFLADNPNLDKDLRLKILENADGLERAVKIRQKFAK